MKTNIILFLKGFIIGIAKIIPGVSGAMLAISFNVYEKGIKSIRYYFDDIKNNTIFLFIIGSSIFLSIILGSKLVLFFLNNYYLITMLLFIGLMIGGLSSIFNVSQIKNKRCLLFIIIPFILVAIIPVLGYTDNLITFDKSFKSFLSLILIGILEASSMIIPGISGTAIMMIIGCYETIINVLSSLTSIENLINNLSILIPFCLGILIGIISLIFIINYLLNKYRNQCYLTIIGLSLASIFILFLETLKSKYTVIDIIIGLILLIFGYKLSSKIDS